MLDLDAFVHYNNGWSFISILAVICFTQKIQNLSIKCNPQFSEFVLILNVAMVVFVSVVFDNRMVRGVLQKVYQISGNCRMPTKYKCGVFYCCFL
jgi:hypothetical protein